MVSSAAHISIIVAVFFLATDRYIIDIPLVNYLLLLAPSHFICPEKFAVKVTIINTVHSSQVNLINNQLNHGDF